MRKKKQDHSATVHSHDRRCFVLLNQLGVDWDPLASMWDARIEQLNHNKAANGHVRVSKMQDYELATWLIYVRTQYKIYQDTPWDSVLTESRITELEKLGVDWNPLES